eukprot:CAMPEP_0183292310 /NCGR_PEP_ID=MMETSP0160_2-20130417/1408_1 /TAXON_ID=2839 ORGANISM="Odontella Sinensis, Strain Grunow 1884" /NCGR_SAMPLE_ID=MMETSP0160_2 /ASSEMBLY_ACC=CAM_ASM_000250 /LENGTH=296 /DNA_ID=CAMNT_0025453239 /DNA_START=134 /DNA_END=1024 /DNA_ORIENTATION=-
MKVFLHYQDNDDTSLHKTLKITLPKSWKNGPSSKLLRQFVEAYNGIEKLGSVNPLDDAQMHLAMREDGTGECHALVIIASDAITIETIPDRGDVYIMHGPSQTLEDIAEMKKVQAGKEKAERENTVACVNFGCKNRFPKEGPYPDCQFHKSPPVFHETAKFWSCCPQKKAYDWEDFQAIPGCMKGKCTHVKEDTSQKQFLGGSDLREQVGGAKLKSIDDFNKSLAAGGSDAAPVLDRLKGVLSELGIEEELFDQVINGMKADLGGTDEALDVVASELGKKLKDAFKVIAREQLRIK